MRDAGTAVGTKRRGLKPGCEAPAGILYPRLLWDRSEGEGRAGMREVCSLGEVGAVEGPGRPAAAAQVVLPGCPEAAASFWQEQPPGEDEGPPYSPRCLAAPW